MKPLSFQTEPREVNSRDEKKNEPIMYATTDTSIWI